MLRVSCRPPPWGTGPHQPPGESTGLPTFGPMAHAGRDYRLRRHPLTPHSPLARLRERGARAVGLPLARLRERGLGGEGRLRRSDATTSGAPPLRGFLAIESGRVLASSLV